MPLPCCQAEVSSQCAELQPLQGPAGLNTQALIGACCCNAAQVLAQLLVAPVRLIGMLHRAPGRRDLQQ